MKRKMKPLRDDKRWLAPARPKLPDIPLVDEDKRSDWEFLKTYFFVMTLLHSVFLLVHKCFDLFSEACKTESMKRDGLRTDRVLCNTNLDGTSKSNIVMARHLRGIGWDES